MPPRLRSADVTDSTIASESELERLDRFPGPPSPRSSSRRFHQKLGGLGAKLPRKKATGRKLLLDGEEDGLRPVEKSAGADVVGEEAREDVGMGGVVVDHLPSERPPFEERWASNGYRQWQARRQAQTPNHIKYCPPVSLDVPPSHMGFFALLPGEIRNTIYHLSLVEPDGPHLIVMQPGTCSLGPCTHMELPTAVPGLLSTCQQIRHEATPIFCAENTFKFDSKTVRERCTANWLRALGVHARLIPSLLLEVMVWEPRTPNSSERVGRPYDVLLHCPAGGIMLAAFHARIKVKDDEGCVKLAEYARKLNEEIGWKRNEELILEFVWSDLMAELVYHCKK